MLNSRTLDKIALSVLALCGVLAVYLAFDLHPFLIGPWESYHFYSSFALLEAPPVRFTIQVGANTAGHYGDNYGLINLWVFIIRKLHLSLTLFNIRFISIIFAFVSASLLYRIAIRWFERYVAITLTLLLLVNETFFLFAHYLLPQMFTFAAILFCLDRFIVLYDETKTISDRNASILLGLAASLCAMNYLIGRLFLGFILLLQLKMILTNKNILRISRQTIKTNLIKFINTWVSYIVFLGIFNIKNIPYTFKKVFIFSDLGEYATESSGFIHNTIFNLPFILKHVFLNIPFYKASLPFFVLGDAKYHLITWPFFCFFFLGVIISIRGITKFSNALICYILGMLLFVMDMSHVYEIFPDGSQNTTLSTFRTFYLLIPVLLAIGVAFQFIIKKLKERFKFFHPIHFVLFIFIPLFSISVRDNVKSFKSFTEFYKWQNFDFNEKAPQRQFSDKELNENLNMRQRIVETQEGIFYKNQVYIRKVAEQISKKVSESSSTGKMAFFLPLDKYTPVYFNVCCSLVDKPYLKIFLSVYLFDMGITNTYIDESGRYRFSEAMVYIVTNHLEMEKVKQDYPHIIITDL